MKRLALIAALMLPTVAAHAQQEPLRPQFHFTPKQNWMNDPNGMVYYDGEWHLFFQYNPFANVWGHMSWGHAVSRDLMHWEQLPVALDDADGTMIFSGSAVVDWKNSSGFGVNGKPPLVAIYTGHREGHQDQRNAYSNDRGRTWTKVPGAVIDLQMADFRDPKVFWHAATSRWIMAVSLPQEHKILFYASQNLAQWTRVGDFGPAGAVKGLWECPDLFPVPVEGGGTKWVLIVNINPDGPAGGSGSQYFVGDFDGTRFVADTPTAPAQWADFGSDFYAGVSWSDVPARDGRRIWLGWMSNWDYAQVVPTTPWRSVMTVPRTLTLRRTPDGLTLVQTPVREFDRLRAGAPRRFAGGTLAAASKWLTSQRALPELLDVELTMKFAPTDGPVTLSFETGENERTTVTVDAGAKTLVVDRSASGRVDFAKTFAAKHTAPLRVQDGSVTLRLLRDRSSLEVFGQGGETVMTELIYPTGTRRGLSLRGASGNSVRVTQLQVHPLASALAGT